MQIKGSISSIFSLGYTLALLPLGVAQQVSPVCLSVCVCVRVSVGVSVGVSVWLSVCFVCLCVWLCVWLCVSLSLCQTVVLSNKTNLTKLMCSPILRY